MNETSFAWANDEMLLNVEQGHPKELSRRTLEAFKLLVPVAALEQSVASWKAGGEIGSVRVKRADVIANQIHVWHGQPIALHVPSGGDDRWYVLPISWQLSFARKNAKTAKQHASNAFDCMMVAIRDVPQSLLVSLPASGLQAACEDAMVESRRKEIRFIVKAVDRLRDAVADVLITTFEEEFGDI